MNVDEEIVLRNGNDTVSCGIDVLLKEMNLLEWSVF